MSLLSNAMEKCVFLNKRRVNDPEGGYITQWEEGAEFDAAIVFDNSMEARTAEKAGVASRYTVSVPKGIQLEYHDVFKRIRDGKILRVTSDGDDVQTPNVASFQIAQVSAEEFDPAKGS